MSDIKIRSQGVRIVTLGKNSNSFLSEPVPFGMGSFYLREINSSYNGKECVDMHNIKERIKFWSIVRLEAAVVKMASFADNYPKGREGLRNLYRTICKNDKTFWQDAKEGLLPVLDRFRYGYDGDLYRFLKYETKGFPMSERTLSLAITVAFAIVDFEKKYGDKQSADNKKDES